MKRLVTCFAAACLAVGGLTLLGCNNSNLPPAEGSGFAGGNGAFGENPSGPGQYDSAAVDDETAGYHQAPCQRQRELIR